MPSTLLYYSTGICHSMCLEMPRIAQFCTYYCKIFWGRTPRPPPFNTTLITIGHATQ